MITKSFCEVFIKNYSTTIRVAIALDLIKRYGLTQFQAAKIATKLYIIPNSTSGTNGPFIMIVPDNIVNDLIKELKSRGLEPSVIGEVIGKGEPEVIAPKKLKEYIADQKILSQFKLE